MPISKCLDSPHNQTSPGWLRGAEAAAGCDSELRVHVGIDLINQGLLWANCPSQTQTSLSPGSAGPPPFKAKLRFGSRNEIKPTRQRTTSHHFLLLSVGFPKSTMPSRSTPVSQPQQTPAPTSQHLPGSELNSLRILQERCKCSAWALIHGKPEIPALCCAHSCLWSPPERTCEAAPLLWDTDAPEWVKWGDKRVRTRQQQRGIARLSSSSEALPLSNVIAATRKDQTASASWPFSSSFIISSPILTGLNVGRSYFLSQRKKML